jgi:hypothetical protein
VVFCLLVAAGAQADAIAHMATRHPIAHMAAQHPATRHATRTRHPIKQAWRYAKPRLIGVGNVPGCLAGSGSGLGVLKTYRAKVLRIVIDPSHAENGEALPCVRAAVAKRYHVHIAIDWNNRWSTRTIVGFFRHVLASYAHYAWAISIGNEQDANQGGTNETGARYASIWRAVEPVVAHTAPHAIRVAGEISPWGITFLKSAFAKKLPGAQVIAVHAYQSPFAFKLASVVAWAHAKHLSLWATEGLNGPGAWSRVSPVVRPLPTAQMLGVAAADAWLG